MMNFFVTKLVVPLHRWLYEVSGGRIGSNLGGIPALLLYVKGHKSGKQYTMPLAYHREGENYFVVASNSALPTNPGWYYNVLADDSVAIRAGTNKMRVQARELTGSEREDVWQRAIQTNPAWDGYRQKTDRTIPLIELRPVDA